jgi:hypothetical protein
MRYGKSTSQEEHRMNILIDNFVTKEDTQCLYLYHELKKMQDANVYYWPNKNISTYDIFDDTNPDIFISHVGAINFELASYLDDNKQKDKLIIVLSTYGVTPESIIQLEHHVEKEQKLFLMHEGKLNSRKLKTIKVNQCVDPNLKQLKFEYSNIDTGYFVKSNSDIKEKNGCYHHISNIADNADICLEEKSMGSMYNNYKRIIFKNLSQFNQSFFDAIYYGGEVYYTSDDKSIDDISEKMFGQVLNINNKSVDFDRVKNIVKEKHMPKNRLKTIMSQLPINQNLFNKVDQ